MALPKRITKLHFLLKSITPSSNHHIPHFSSRRFHKPNSPFSSSSSPDYDNDASKIVDGLISIFTHNPPSSPQIPQLTRYGSKLTTHIVESVLSAFKSWKKAHTFFNWASDQSGYKHNCYTYNLMASILSRARQNAPLKVLAVDLVNSGCFFPPGALGFFIRCLGAQGLIDEANVVFDQFRKKGLCVPNNYSYNCLLEAISKSGSVDLMEMRLKEMRDSGWVLENKYMLTPVLQCYCNAGKFDKALKVFNQLREQGWLDSHVLSILLLSFSKWGEVDKAFELIQKMEDDLGIPLNQKSFFVLIHGFVRESRVDKALQLFDKMLSCGFAPDISLYDVLIRGLCKNKETGKALFLYSQMVDRGIWPDITILTNLVSSLSSESEMTQLIKDHQKDMEPKSMTLLYNAVLKALVNNGFVDKAFHLLLAMTGDKVIGDSDVGDLFMVKEFASPDTTSFQVVIDGLCRTRELDMALRLFRDMDQIGCTKSQILFNNLIDGLGNANRVEECYELLKEMKELGLKPTHFTHNSIFGCLCRGEDVAGALDMVREMRAHGHEPWIKHSTLLVKKLCSHGKAVEACNFLTSMVQEGFLPHVIAYTAAVDGFFKIHEVDRALELFKDICARGYCPDVVAYNTVINGLCKAERIAEAQDFLNEMLEKGLVPSVVTYNSLIDGWCKTGDIDRAMLCLSRMIMEEREPNIITYTTLVDGLCNARRPDDALKLWKEMEEKGCSPNRIAFMALISGLCKCGKPDTALVHFQEMEEKEMTPDTFVYVALIYAFLSNLNAPLAFEVLKKMVHSRAFLDSGDKNHSIVKEAILKLSEDSRTSTNVKNLVAESSILTNLMASDVGSEDEFEPIT